MNLICKNYFEKRLKHRTETVEALLSGHPRDAIKMSVTGTGRLREWSS